MAWQGQLRAAGSRNTLRCRMTGSLPPTSGRRSPFQAALAQAMRLLELANHEALPLRLFGSVAVFASAGELASWYSTHRRAPHDIDAVSLRSARSALRAALGAAGYSLNDRLSVATEGQLYVFTAFDKLDIEVRFDVLNFSHTIPLAAAFDGPGPSIPLGELLLSKLGIVDVSETDICDSLVLLHCLHVSNDAEGIPADVARLIGRLGNDWGAWYTTVRNLMAADVWLTQFGASLPEESQERVAAGAHFLINALNDSPKSFRWRARSVLGSRVRWYQIVSQRG